ncbi:MAG: hypothetical protein JWP25_8322 [Bradyrhizobium sp.]|nr:hypothetical protein [Bradyrhizobium sp.]
MTTIFCIGPAKRNIGNDVISTATADLLYSHFGQQTSVVNIPALEGFEHGGLTASSVYDMNRFADGVLVCGGNLFENGQMTVDLQALNSLQVPMMLMGLSYGRIYDRTWNLSPRTDSMPPAIINALVDKSIVRQVRDGASETYIQKVTKNGIEVGGCPSMFLAPNSPGILSDGQILVSIRHPGCMNVPPELQWRIADDLRRLIGRLQQRFSSAVALVCHDYKDLEFAAAFSNVPHVYFDNVHRYFAAMRRCRINVTYRLHAFLPCLAFGTPSINISYDERGSEMVATAGMAAWDIDLGKERDVVEAVMDRVESIDRYHSLRSNAQVRIGGLKEITMNGLSRFSKAISEMSSHQRAWS